MKILLVMFYCTKNVPACPDLAFSSVPIRSSDVGYHDLRGSVDFLEAKSNSATFSCIVPTAMRFSYFSRLPQLDDELWLFILTSLYL